MIYFILDIGSFPGYNAPPSGREMEDEHVEKESLSDRFDFAREERSPVRRPTIYGIVFPGRSSENRSAGRRGIGEHPDRRPAGFAPPNRLQVAQTLFRSTHGGSGR